MKYAIQPVLEEIEQWLVDNQLDTYKPVEVGRVGLNKREGEEALALLLKLSILNRGETL